VNYTVLCPNVDSGTFVPSDFTIFSYGGLTNTHTITGNVLSIRGELGLSNHGSANISCSPCVESIIREYYKEVTKCNISCFVNKDLVPISDCALQLITSGCNGNVTYSGWTATHFTGSPTFYLGGGKNCPTNSLCFTATPGGAYDFCQTATCSVGYGVTCSCTDCETVCENVIDLNKMAIADRKSNNSDNFEIFPIPSNGILYITAESDKEKLIKIEVCNLLGSKLQVFDRSIVKGQNAVRLDLKSLSKGNYLIKINNEGQIINKRISIVE